MPKLPAPRPSRLVQNLGAQYSEGAPPSVTSTTGAPRHEPLPPASPPPSHRPVVAPLSPARFKIQCTVDQDTHDDLRRLQSLMRHQIPNGDPAAIIKKALAMLLADVEKKKLGLVARPLRTPRPARADSRHVPKHVVREVWNRDAARCRFVGPAGRCEERDHLELHHVVPYARGGQTTAQNLELRCRSHNQHVAELDYGEAFMDGKRAGA